MNGPTDKEVILSLTPNPGCRIAYTLNNAQPVRCTMIGDEPLFFLDATETFEDESLFDMSLLEDLSLEIGDMQKKLSAYDALSKEYRRSEDFLGNLFASEATEIENEQTSRTPDQAAFYQLLLQSRLLATLKDFAEERGVKIAFSSQAETSEYDRDGGRILINPDLDTPYQILLAARELRRCWQHKTGVLVDPMAFFPDQGILINRIQASDLAVFMIRAAWELQLAGDKSVWEWVENSSLSDLGRAFAREACCDFRSLNNGQAALSTMEAWFLSERCRRHDRSHIQRMLAGPVTGAFDRSEAASRQAALSVIQAMGETPYGKNYLSAHARAIMDDPVFCEVRDRANANFLWFIKFENSFLEAEEELGLAEKESNSEQKGETRDPVLSYTQESHAHVIPFPGKTTAQDHINSKRRTGTSGSSEGTILPFGKF